MEKFKESKKTVELTYDEARSMYFSGNEALKTIAIIAFGKLAFMDENEIGELISSVIPCKESIMMQPEDDKVVQEYAIMRALANWFNCGWVKTDSNSGYFIGGFDKSGNPFIYKHQQAVYRYGIYFKNEEDARTAFKMTKNYLENIYGKE